MLTSKKCIELNSLHFMHTQYATEIQEFGDGSNRQGVRLTLLNPQLQDSGHYICTAQNQFETRTETVQLSVWLSGVYNIACLIRAAELGNPTPMNTLYHQSHVHVHVSLPTPK